MLRLKGTLWAKDRVRSLESHIGPKERPPTLNVKEAQASVEPG